MRADQGPSCKPVSRRPLATGTRWGVRLSPIPDSGARALQDERGMRVEWGSHGPLQHLQGCPPRPQGCQRPFSRGRGQAGASRRPAGPHTRAPSGNPSKSWLEPWPGEEGGGLPLGRPHATWHCPLPQGLGLSALAAQLYPWPCGSPDHPGKRWPILQARDPGPVGPPGPPALT